MKHCNEKGSETSFGLSRKVCHDPPVMSATGSGGEKGACTLLTCLFGGRYEPVTKNTFFFLSQDLDCIGLNTSSLPLISCMSLGKSLNLSVS